MNIEALVGESGLWQDIEQAWIQLAVGYCQLCILNGSFKTMGLSQPIKGYGQNVVTEANMYAGFSERNRMFVLRKPKKSNTDTAGTRHGPWLVLETRSGALIITRSSAP